MGSEMCIRDRFNVMCTARLSFVSASTLLLTTCLALKNILAVSIKRYFIIELVEDTVTPGGDRFLRIGVF